MTNNICKVDGCTKELNGKGYCGSHYARYRKYGDAFEFFPLGGRYFEYPEYSNFKAMIDRCRPSAAHHHTYYDKGISVCERWAGQNGFLHFYRDMGKKPSPEHSIERIDSNKGYYKDNCKWGTYLEQGNNTSRNRRLTYKGRTMTMSQWAAELGMHRHTIRQRVNAGWKAEDILTISPSHGNRWLGLGVSDD